MGWDVEVTVSPLDPTIPEWGESRYVDLRLRGELRLADALNQLYVLLPVLDDAKHYWVSSDEVEKLIRAGEGWLGRHPEKALITRRYLAHRRELTQSALARLAEIDDTAPETLDSPGEPITPPNLAQVRRETVLTAVADSGARTVADLGCGEGQLLLGLLSDPRYTRILGTDVSFRALKIAARRVEKLVNHRPERIDVFQSALTYRDERLTDLDAAVLMEVIEHIDPPRLGAVERSIFGYARPRSVIVTTPNAEYNVRYETLAAGAYRHSDHRFEWTRSEFQAWGDSIAARHDYSVRYAPVGSDDPEVGPPTQMAIFSRLIRTVAVDSVDSVVEESA